MKNDWRTITCPRCRGYGQISVYTLGGTDFDGATECPDCACGVLWVRPSDHVFAYPGGPARGSWPGAWAKANREGDGNELCRR